MAEPTTGRGTVPRWVQLWTLGLALLGLAVSAYLTVEHFTTPALLACPDTGALNCGKVTSSPESKLAGVPVAVLGLAYYGALVALMTPRAWRAPRLAPVRLAALAGGVLFVGWLVYVELFRVGAICLYCTVVHVTTVALFAVVLLADTEPERP